MNITHAVKLMQKANRELKRNKLSVLLRGINYHKCIYYYNKAGNIYKYFKHWNAAAFAFIDSAILNLKLADKYEAAKCYIEASICFKQININKSIMIMQQAIALLQSNKNYYTATVYNTQLVELFIDNMDYINAIAVCKNLCDHYRSEFNYANLKKCLQKKAEIYVKTKNYCEAAACYSELNTLSVDNLLFNCDTRVYYLKECLCYLMSKNFVAIENKLKSLQQSSFNDLEYKFIINLMQAENDNDNYARIQIIQQFNEIYKFANEIVDMLTEIENMFCGVQLK